LKFGIGARYGFTTILALRAQWERFTVGLFEKADADLVSLGLEWRF
jgi:hypothetical protein